MLDPAAVATGGGTAGLVIAVTYAVKALIVDPVRARRNGTTARTSSAVTDAATANSVLLKSLESETRRADRAEERERSKDEQIRRLEAELASVRDQLADMTRQVADMSERLRSLHND